MKKEFKTKLVCACGKCHTKEFNLSEKIWDTRKRLYKEKDIKEFIRLLKEEFQDIYKPKSNNEVKRVIDNLAGDLK
ncbi:hypothetical protein LCGC14_0851970 [marine sediment metagenome]|uniref:Uncharacterized protein n=1 Tax=marine sediment metagenome TaxID=412755 RepID=A0A0F9P9Z4_9ZZZZ